MGVVGVGGVGGVGRGRRSPLSPRIALQNAAVVVGVRECVVKDLFLAVGFH